MKPTLIFKYRPLLIVLSCTIGICSCTKEGIKKNDIENDGKDKDPGWDSASLI